VGRKAERAAQKQNAGAGDAYNFKLAQVNLEKRVKGMRRGRGQLAVIVTLAAAWMAAVCAWGEAPAPALAAFDTYTGTVEAKLAQDHRSRVSFLAGEAGTAEGQLRLRRGEVLIDEIKAPGVEGAMVHDWRGSAFAPGAKAADFENLLVDYDAYPRVFAPQVLKARRLMLDGGHVQGWMRVKQKHVITVVLDTTYDGHHGGLDAQDRWSVTRSTKVEEIEGVGTSHERALTPQEDHGFLWRMNTYWTWQERDGGLYLQIESVTLSRGLPEGLAWIVQPFVESIPRESLEFTLRAASRAVSRQ
jgi:hypothetical protein